MLREELGPINSGLWLALRLSQRVAFAARWLARSRLGRERGLHARGRHRALAARHQVTGDFFSFRDFSRKSVPSEKASSGAADQYAVLQVALLQLPPAVIHSPVRTTSQAQMAFLGLAGSTVQGLSRHHVQGYRTDISKFSCPVAIA